MKLNSNLDLFGAFRQRLVQLFPPSSCLKGRLTEHKHPDREVRAKPRLPGCEAFSQSLINLERGASHPLRLPGRLKRGPYSVEVRTDRQLLVGCVLMAAHPSLSHRICASGPSGLDWLKSLTSVVAMRTARQSTSDVSQTSVPHHGEMSGRSAQPVGSSVMISQDDPSLPSVDPPLRLCL
jgi:hypothetical protein